MNSILAIFYVGREKNGVVLESVQRHFSLRAHTRNTVDFKKSSSYITCGVKEDPQFSFEFFSYIIEYVELLEVKLRPGICCNCIGLQKQQHVIQKKKSTEKLSVTFPLFTKFSKIIIAAQC